MTWQEVETMIGVWLPRLGLTHWKVTVDWENPADEGDDATIERQSPYDVATVRFASEVYGWEAAFAERVVVHELIHLVTRDLEEATEASHALLPVGARRIAEGWHHHELEGVIDRLAAVLVAVAAA